MKLTTEELKKAKELVASGEMFEDMVQAFKDDFISDVIHGVSDLLDVIEEQQSEIAELKKEIKQYQIIGKKLCVQDAELKTVLEQAREALKLAKGAITVDDNIGEQLALTAISNVLDNKRIHVPDECYEQYGDDLDGCSTQEREGCGNCKIALDEGINNENYSN